MLLNDMELKETVPTKQQATVTERIRSSLLSVTQNWKNLAALVCLWIAYFICTMGLSLLGPFLPQEVQLCIQLEFDTKI